MPVPVLVPLLADFQAFTSAAAQRLDNRPTKAEVDSRVQTAVDAANAAQQLANDTKDRVDAMPSSLTVSTVNFAELITDK